MKFCWLGIHRWGKWADYGKPVSYQVRNIEGLYGVPVYKGEWMDDGHRQHQKRTCENCGVSRTRKYRV